MAHPKEDGLARADADGELGFEREARMLVARFDELCSPHIGSPYMPRSRVNCQSAAGDTLYSLRGVRCARLSLPIRRRVSRWRQAFFCSGPLRRL